LFLRKSYNCLSVNAGKLTGYSEIVNILKITIMLEGYDVMSNLYDMANMPGCCASCENHVCFDKTDPEHRRYAAAVADDPATGKQECPYYCVSEEEEDAY